jgi:hypothetical protein
MVNITWLCPQSKMINEVLAYLTEVLAYLTEVLACLARFSL